MQDSCGTRFVKRRLSVIFLRYVSSRDSNMYIQGRECDQWRVSVYSVQFKMNEVRKFLKEAHLDDYWPAFESKYFFLFLTST